MAAYIAGFTEELCPRIRRRASAASSAFLRRTSRSGGRRCSRPGIDGTSMSLWSARSTDTCCGERSRLHMTSRSSVRPRWPPRNAGTPNSVLGVAAVSGCGDASRPTQRRRRRREGGGARLAGDLPRATTFFRGGNIGSPLRITSDTCWRADSLVERLDLLERLLEVLDQDVAISS